MNKTTENEMTAFDHGFETTFGVIDINGIQGYIKCLYDLLKYLEETTEFKPEKRMIDAVPLLDKITETNNELAIVLQEEKKRIDEELEKKL